MTDKNYRILDERDSEKQKRENLGLKKDILAIKEDIKEVNTQFNSINNKLSNFNTTIQDVNVDISVIESRVNNLTKMNEGSTTGDAELQDIRVGTNGIIYDTAGTAVRNQFSEVNKVLMSSVKDELVNIRPLVHVEAGSIDGSTGEDKTGAGKFRSEYLSTDLIKTVTVPTNYFIFLLYYNLDEAGNYVLAYTKGSPYAAGTYKINKSYEYVRFTMCRSSYATTMKIEETLAYEINAIPAWSRSVKPDIFAYVADGKKVTWKNNNTCELYIEANVLLKGGLVHTINLEDILSVAEAAGLSVSNGFISANSFALVFNVDTKTLRCINNVGASSNLIAKNEITLFIHHYASLNDGLLVDYHNSRIDEVIKDYSKKDIPTYFVSNIETAISTISANMGSVGKNGETFIFITDTHWDQNSKNSPALINKIINETGIKNVICGGDLISQGTKTAMMSVMKAHMQAFNFLGDNFKTIFGNHDLNTNLQESAEYADRWFSEGEAFSMMHSNLSNVNYGDYFYYSFDNNITKTRYICLDTRMGNISEEQMVWLKNLLEKDNYNVIIFAHWLYTPTKWNDTLSGGTFTSYAKNLFTLCDNYLDKIKAIFYGHIHADKLDFTTGGIPIIATDTDSYYTYGDNTATKNDVTEQCFDIVTINYNDNSVKCVRVGRGKNREVTRE